MANLELLDERSEPWVDPLCILGELRNLFSGVWPFEDGAGASEARLKVREQILARRHPTRVLLPIDQKGQKGEVASKLTNRKFTLRTANSKAFIAAPFETEQNGERGRESIELIETICHVVRGHGALRDTP